MNKTELIRPDSRYEDSLRSFVREFLDAGEELDARQSELHGFRVAHDEIVIDG